MRHLNVSVRRRAGFTLIELLVVIGIIVILISLSAGAYFRVSSNQIQRRAETTVKNLQIGMDGQWQAVIDSAKDDLKRSGASMGANGPLYAKATGLSNGDPARARSIYIKLRLIQEFPNTFFEAINPANLAPSATVGLPNTYSSVAKATYRNAFPAGTIAPGGPVESSICLYLALNQGRRGATFDSDTMGPGIVTPMQCGTAQLYYYADSWGQPITFERWTADPAIIAELSASPYASSQGSVDKDDPEGALYLMKANWKQSDADRAAAVIGHAITVGPAANIRPNSRNRGFVIRSAGPDKAYFGNDDILGFRLTIEGQRGN